MGCMDSNTSSSYARDAKYEELRDKLDQVSRYLCSACKYMEQLNIDIPLEIKNWWITHQEEDRIRIEQEKQEARKDKILHLISDKNYLLKDKEKIEEWGGSASQKLLDKIIAIETELKALEREG